MAKELIRNVEVDGKWWGPAYGTPTPPSAVAAKITNPAAWSTYAEDTVDLRSRRDDFGVDDEEPVPNLSALAPPGATVVGSTGGTSAEDLAELSPEDLAAYAGARGLGDAPVKTKTDRERLIAQLTGG